MKKYFVFFATVIAFSQLYINCLAQSGITDYSGERFEDADIPLVQEGINYFIRPLEDNDDSYIVMLPLSAVLYEYADVSWDEGQGRVNVTCGTLDVSMEIGNTSYIINGERARLEAAPEIINQSVYVPYTFFEKTFGFWMTDSGDGVIDLFIPSFIIENI